MKNLGPHCFPEMRILERKVKIASLNGILLDNGRYGRAIFPVHTCSETTY